MNKENNKIDFLSFQFENLLFT